MSLQRLWEWKSIFTWMERIEFELGELRAWLIQIVVVLFVHSHSIHLCKSSTRWRFCLVIIDTFHFSLDVVCFHRFVKCSGKFQWTFMTFVCMEFFVGHKTGKRQWMGKWKWRSSIQNHLNDWKTTQTTTVNSAKHEKIEEPTNVKCVKNENHEGGGKLWVIFLGNQRNKSQSIPMQH